MKKIKKVMAAMTITGIMAAMPVSANAASITPVTTFDVSKQFESLINKMNDSLLPKEDLFLGCECMAKACRQRFFWCH